MKTLKDYSQETQSEVKQVRELVSNLHDQLIKWNLVVWTAGNVSQRLHTADLMVIKPSGVRYERLTPESMIVCDLDGNVVDGSYSPSSDTASHAYIYRNMPEVFGVVHTHSTYATAWAAIGENIPCGLTMMGDEFGGPVPVGPFRLIGSEAIGQGVVETLRKYPKSPAVLMQNHGPFVIGKDAESAVKAASMTEEVAKTMWAARQIGKIIDIKQEDINSLNKRYQNVYGQN
ncbi:L-ribulose-5-phosphate 4-epimerase [Gardnerella sp. DNF00476]|jgi:L-ribulose-5-phosphate 4-epimerase|uniref:L-ribulose-5-phosphate 4-epimerase n=3 Tax=Gardnerella vaginalis TaxID=2702 RepID=A0A2I1KPD7_GARVA|nr:L-ribulose-5-phosphate 4-epimerase [Gardnerella vaginalis]EIK76075.1 L-ribulose-5-phosphate 4-epimerase [Gardnerella vaginalis 284V]MBE0296756.1 L-ribulose-5-phosphate 4-epimerase [Gardnerella vaginalis]PKY97490.1 L-ribulose-5-phosphate 4-epimerase [Gardnerella vaginalis]PKZ58344.1 L-ribulose-5-phosphate 4-epimerase [Gardnerella vaginalis]RFT29804.1 L-ribulose-5-phosphate 4-epimerase [Gardnerella vaginalis]